MTQSGRFGLLLSATLLLVAALAARYLVLWEHGLRISPDSIRYIRTAISFYQGEGLVFTHYVASRDMLVHEPLTHYPPLASLAYGAPLLLGLPMALGPAGVSLVCWLALLAGLGLLTYRLSSERMLALLAVMLAAVSYPFLYVFEWVWSEVVFLPLLVFAAWALTNVPTRAQPPGAARLALVVVLLASLMLTRYVGVFFYAATLIWWVGWRLALRQHRRLWVEVPALGLAGVPLALWLLRNVALTGHLFGPDHTRVSQTSFIDGLLGVLSQLPWLLTPGAPLSVFLLRSNYTVLIFAAGAVLLLAGGIVLWWRWLRHLPPGGWARWQQRGVRLFASPLPLWALTYLALYTLAQPFMRFTPLDLRDFTTLYCVLLPLGFAALAALPRPVGGWLAGGYVALNVALLALALSFAPLRTLPLDWLDEQPPRTRDLARYHPEVLTALEDVEGAAIVTNLEHVFAPHPEAGYPGSARLSLITWLQEGTCTPRRPVVIVLFDWRFWQPDRWPSGMPRALPPESPRELLAQTCPGLTPIHTEHALLYLVPPAR